MTKKEFAALALRFAALALRYVVSMLIGFAIASGVVALVGLSFKPPAKPNAVARENTEEPPRHHDVQRWLKLYQIWSCDDGTFQVRTDYSDHGHFLTLESAKAYKRARAEQMADLIEQKEPELPACGKRLE